MDNQALTIQNSDSAILRELGIYIHIPFCIKKCDYCDFLSAAADDDTKRNYFKALLIEIESYRGRTNKYLVPTIFFGGGTPSCVETSYIEATMHTIKEVFQLDYEHLEATIEVNPGTVSKEKLESYRKAGINRLSFGLQSANNRELQLLGRIHTFEQLEKNYLLAREVGFDNINIDLMSALPGQTLQSWIHTLETVIKLQPNHISAYSLIIEEGTKFYERYKEDAAGYADLPDEEQDRLIYHKTKEILEKNGFFRYEISNYAKPDYECRHNSSYWIGTDYLGLGLGASSLLNNARFTNKKELNTYIEKCTSYQSSIIPNHTKLPYEKYNKDMYFDDLQEKDNKERHPDQLNMESDKNMYFIPPDKKNIKDMNSDVIGLREDYNQLSLQEQMEEYMFLGLRMCRGVSKKVFLDKFGKEIEEIYPKVLQQLIDNKLLICQEDRLFLSEYGVDVSNTVLSLFLLS